MTTTNRPRGLAFTLLVMCLFNPTGYLFVQWGTKKARAEALFDTLFIIAGYVVLVFYWRGKSWARILVILTSLLALYNVHLILRLALLQRLIIIGEAMFGAYLLYWLNKPGIREYFRGSPAAEPNSPSPAN